jgi:arsenate-mycothiol transferase
VLFVCVKNSGKSQMAAALMCSIAGDDIEVFSAGTHPGAELNSLSVQSLQELGIDIAGEHPQPIGAELLRRADVVVTLGREARVDPVPGPRFENWDTDEPSRRGIDGIERMRLIRDDIQTRVRELATELQAATANH